MCTYIVVLSIFKGFKVISQTAIFSIYAEICQNLSQLQTSVTPLIIVQFPI